MIKGKRFVFSCRCGRTFAQEKMDDWFCPTCANMMSVIGSFDYDVEINGNVTIGKGVSVCGPCDINGNLSSVTIGDGSDIGAFGTINCADSHLRCLGLSQEIARKPIVLGDHVFVGTHCAILGDSRIGHHSVIAAGTIVRGLEVAPWSLVSMAERGVTVMEGYYTPRADRPIYPPGA
jgi:acetyltransferase-like isoleucine patch superfamily enzyme